MSKSNFAVSVHIGVLNDFVIAFYAKIIKITLGIFYKGIEMDNNVLLVVSMCYVQWGSKVHV